MLKDCESIPALETIITLSNLLMCINSAARSLKQHIKYFNFLSKIQLDHPVYIVSVTEHRMKLKE